MGREKKSEGLELSWAERQGVKLLAWRVKRMDGVKRWLPVASTVVLLVHAVLSLLGYVEAAQALETLRGLSGLEADPELVAGVGVLVTAIGGAGVGVFRKVKAQVQKAQAK